MESLPLASVSPEPRADLSGEPRNAIDLFRARVAQSGTRTALRYKAEGAWRTMSWLEWNGASREIAAGLRAAGVQKGDRICVLAASRPEWFLCDVAILMAGAATVPIYPSSTPEQCEYIVKDCGARIVIVENPEQAAKLFAPSVRANLAALGPIVTFDTLQRLDKPDAKGRTQLSLADCLPGEVLSRVTALDALRTQGRSYLAEHSQELERAWDAVTPDEIFTIVYTSGTTGEPKGVVLTHGNLVFECQALLTGIPIGPDDEQLLFLPLAHIFARILEWMGSITVGSVTAFAQNLTTIKSDLLEIRPTYMGATPRVYEKLYAGILAQVRQGPALRQKIFRWASDVGTRASRCRQEGRAPSGRLALEHVLADWLVFGKLRKKLGLDRVRFLVSGGAPLARDICEFFHAQGLLILEGYGLTETTAATHVNRPDKSRFGTVGLPVPGVEVKFAEDGEILIRGGNVLREYYRKEAETRAALEPDGWFHTGDIGVLEDEFLRITDRKKDLIVTSGGKKIAPQLLENRLKITCPLISQVLVHGDKRNFLTALVTLNEEVVRKWALEVGVSTEPVALAADAKLHAAIEEAIARFNATLASYETIKKFAVLAHDFTQESGELTPTLKVKRKVVSEKYKERLDALYATGESR